MHFLEWIYICIYIYIYIYTVLKISLMFVPKVPFSNGPALVQIMAWRRPGDTPLSEPMITLLTHICVTRSQWVNGINIVRSTFPESCSQANNIPMSQHWFGSWLGPEQATSHYLNQWRLSLLTHIYFSRLINPEFLPWHWPFLLRSFTYSAFKYASVSL